MKLQTTHSRRNMPNAFVAPSAAILPEPLPRPAREPDDRAPLVALDLLPDGVGLFDLSGMLLGANRVLTAAINRSAESGRLFHEMLRLAREVGERIRRDTPAAGTRLGAPAEVLVSRDLGSAEGRYRLRGSRVDLDCFGLGPAVVIMVELPDTLPAPEEALQSRFGLTRCEAKVARLLAKGRSNKGIAAELSISPHTARHHTQRVLQKLGARARAEVGHKLQG